MLEIEEKPYTWAQLKEFANSLTDGQLQQTVKIMIGDDESPTDVDDASELGDDHYYWPDYEYGCTKDDFDKDCITDDLGDPKYQTFEQAIAGDDELYITPANRVYLHSFL